MDFVAVDQPRGRNVSSSLRSDQRRPTIKIHEYVPRIEIQARSLRYLIAQSRHFQTENCYGVPALDYLLYREQGDAHEDSSRISSTR